MRLIISLILTPSGVLNEKLHPLTSLIVRQGGEEVAS